MYVGGLGPGMEESVVYAAFLPFGEIKSIELPNDALTSIQCSNVVGAPKGYAFVEFEEPEDCRHAIDNMNGAELFGRVLKVSYAKRAKFREGSNKPVWAEEKYIASKAQAEERETET